MKNNKWFSYSCPKKKNIPKSFAHNSLKKFSGRYLTENFSVAIGKDGVGMSSKPKKWSLNITQLWQS